MRQALETRQLTPGALRLAAVVLIVAPILEMAAMAHHPSISSHDVTEVAAQLRALAARAAQVHGALIALIFAVLLAVMQFARRRGLSRATVSSGLLLYAAGVLLMTPAALVDGFIVPRVALAVPGMAPADAALVAQFAAFAMLFNQAFAKCAAVLISAGIAAFSLDLAGGAPPERSLGIFGLASGLACALAVATGILPLNVHGMSLVLCAQALWTIAVGALLLRRAQP